MKKKILAKWIALGVVINFLFAGVLHFLVADWIHHFWGAVAAGLMSGSVAACAWIGFDEQREHDRKAHKGRSA